MDGLRPASVSPASAFNSHSGCRDLSLNRVIDIRAMDEGITVEFAFACFDLIHSSRLPDHDNARVLVRRSVTRYEAHLIKVTTDALSNERYLSFCMQSIFFPREFILRVIKV